MRKFLASTFALALFAMAFAGAPIDYELFCETEVDTEPVKQLIGVLSLTEGGVHVALVADLVCESDLLLVVGPVGAPEIVVVIDWNVEPLEVFVTIGDVTVTIDDVVLVVVPQVAIDGMLNAQRLRAAAMDRRAEAEARRDAAREGRAGDGEYGEAGHRAPVGPPEVIPPIENPVEPPVDMPYGEVPEGPPAGVPPVERPGERP